MSAAQEPDEVNQGSGHTGRGEPCTSCGVRGGHWNDCPRYSYAGHPAAPSAQPDEDWWRREDGGPICQCGHAKADHHESDGCGACAMQMLRCTRWPVAQSVRDTKGHQPAPELSAAELRFLDRPDAPESLRERLAAEFAEEDQAALRGPALGWPEAQRVMVDGGAYYRRLADRAIRVLTESALR